MNKFLKKAGAMLLVMALEKAASMIMPTFNAETGILLPFSSKMRVRLLTTSRTVCSGILQAAQSVYDIVTKVVLFSERMSSISPSEM